ncbi:hypothetical protein E2562_024382, partial [Oryza meyeriana var. granulata]
NEPATRATPSSSSCTDRGSAAVAADADDPRLPSRGEEEIGARGEEDGGARLGGGGARALCEDGGSGGGDEGVRGEG